MNCKVKFSFSERNSFPTNFKNSAFTLLELIIVIIIIGILATLGLATYTNQVEYSRIAEAKANLGAMRKLAMEYYMKNGTLADIQSSDVGVDYTCRSTHYYQYRARDSGPNYVTMQANRCTSGGKSPDASTAYYLLYWYEPSSGKVTIKCAYGGLAQGCFGMEYAP